MARPPVKTFLDRARARDVRKIVVVDFGFLGDSVHLAPSLWEIRRAFPQAELHTVSAGVGAELLKLVPCVDRAWMAPLPAESPSWWRHWGLLAALRKERFDLAFNFSGADRTLFCLAAIGARMALAQEGVRRHGWARALRAEWVPRQPQIDPVFEQRRQVLAGAGWKLEPPRFDLRVPEAAKGWAAEALNGEAVHLALGASSPAKEWPLENWAALVRLLVQRQPSLILAASAGPGKREQEKLRLLADAVKTPQLRCFNSVSIPQLAALLQRCRLQIGGDSGVLHVALALGVPTLAFFREYPGVAEWMPRGPAHRALRVPCPCLLAGKNDCAAQGRSECLGSISPERALDEVCQLLK